LASEGKKYSVCGSIKWGEFWHAATLAAAKSKVKAKLGARAVAR